LNFSGNAVRRIPESIASLKALQQIDAKHNEMAKLPAELGELTSLVKIDRMPL